MTHQFTIHFNEQHIKYAEFKYWLRSFGDHLFIWCFALVILVVKGFLQMKFDWLTGFLTGVLFIWGLFMFESLRSGRVERMNRLKQHGERVSYHLSDETLKVRSDSQNAELKWDSFKALWVFSRAWLLVSKGGGYLTFPVDQTPAEAGDFLKQKAAAVGAEVK